MSYYFETQGRRLYIASDARTARPIAACFANSYEAACSKLREFVGICNIGERLYTTDILDSIEVLE